MKNKNKILTLLVVLLLLSPAYAQFTQIGKFAKKWVWGERKAWALLSFLAWVGWMTRSAAKQYSTHLKDYVLTNPDPTAPETLRVMGFFISIAQTFYILAIAVTGFYLIFVSGTPRGRSKAKYTLGKLFLGMALVSISPFLLQLLFQFSYSLTDAILDQGELSVVTREFETLMARSFEGHIILLVGPVYEKIPRGWRWWMGRRYPVPGLGFETARWLPRIGSLMAFLEKYVEVGGGGIDIMLYPYFLFIITLVLVFSILAFRYLMVMIWTILFPLSIFFTSFDLTKDVGRTMMEQTLQWTLFQVFYAVVLVAMSIGITMLPEGYKGYSIWAIPFYSLAVVAILFFGPWFLSSILQRLFPP